MKASFYYSVANLILQKLSCLDFILSAHDEICLIDVGCRSKNNDRVMYISFLLNSDLVLDDKPDEIVYEIKCIKKDYQSIAVSADLTYGDGVYYKKWDEILIQEGKDINDDISPFFINLESDITKMIFFLTNRGG
ncbi:hypothetical protein [Cronobacter malonaticus]|uniref:hypothetical protein n=1 Tax=Cronobacter malonaticus TaxID=413503 RepID=UPI0024AF2B86|nr:hypothetical protein [Cronobacter malonaticus]MDI7691619.1 hypothetical protein [Cronobacter malonaticus]MDK1300145.1 hypothetical protein [Cronobacter malonaticus]